MNMKAMVIVRYDETGHATFHVCGGENVRLFIVDERAPGDRVYEWLSRCDGDEMREILRDDPIGSSADERHAAISNVVLSAAAGKPHLEVVK